MELANVISTFRPDWSLAERIRLDDVIGWMLEHTKLHQVAIHSEIRGSTVRYIWGDASPLEIAATLAPRGYFCHATAASLHGLLTYNPETIYLNREQSAKPASDGPLSQDAVDRAFSKKQRASQDVYHWGSTRVAILSGKHSGRLEVHRQSVGGLLGQIDVTGIERTLIDLTVRPDYAGGPVQVLEAFRRSKDRISVDRLLATLEALSYRYPYHQAIGFYMQRAGYPEIEVAKLRALGTAVDFYVGYGVTERDFDSAWCVHFPRDLSLVPVSRTESSPK
jgi:hypothetical protein